MTNELKGVIEDNSFNVIVQMAETGARGKEGKSAYSSAQDGGYTDTEANFYADLAAIGGLAVALNDVAETITAIVG